MANHQQSLAPTDPFNWRESVLSTRSLSHVSIADFLGSQGLPTPIGSRNSSVAFPRMPTRRSTMDEGSEYSLEMAGTTNGDRIAEQQEQLPASVANSLLFTLPREIRERIYVFSLTTPTDQMIQWPTSSSSPFNLAPSLLRTCKLIYSEAAPVLYTNNTFSFSLPSDANMFVRALASTHFSRAIARLNLQIRAQDTRLWMPYLTSADATRSLKADFPVLRELKVRYKSTKWNHGQTVEKNIRNWKEDKRLEEMIVGLRQVFFPQEPQVPDGDKDLEMRDGDFADYLDRHPEVFRADDEASFKQQLLQLSKARAAYAAHRAPPPPVVRVICSFHVAGNHFSIATTDQDPSQGANPPPPPPLGFAAGILPPLPGITVAPPTTTESAPAQEGADFQGFSKIDFRGRGRTIVEEEAAGAEMGHRTAQVAQTVFANKDKILVALEIFCVKTPSWAELVF